MGRKAAALIDASEFSEAKATLNTLLEVDPNNASARQMMNNITRKQAASNKSAKKIYSKMMEGMERDARTGLTWREWGMREATVLVERLLSIDIAERFREIRSLRCCRRRPAKKKD